MNIRIYRKYISYVHIFAKHVTTASGIFHLYVNLYLNHVNNQNPYNSLCYKHSNSTHALKKEKEKEKAL